jgi:hypothetical protein
MARLLCNAAAEPIMSAETARPPPNLFDSAEVPVLSEAFAKAWRALAPLRTFPDDDRASTVMQSRIAATIMDVASEGVMDSNQLAKAAIERCSNAPNGAMPVGIREFVHRVLGEKRQPVGRLKSKPRAWGSGLVEMAKIPQRPLHGFSLKKSATNSP